MTLSSLLVTARACPGLEFAFESFMAAVGGIGRLETRHGSYWAAWSSSGLVALGDSVSNVQKLAENAGLRIEQNNAKDCSPSTELMVPDWERLPGGFRGAVLRACFQIPSGKTVSYAELAVAAGSPGAARAVGSAMAHNPLPIIIPCHRVVRADGNVGEYSLGGSLVKARMLAAEGVVVKEGRVRVLSGKVK